MVFSAWQSWLKVQSEAEDRIPPFSLREHIRLAVLIAICANTQVDFSGVFVCFEGLGDAWVEFSRPERLCYICIPRIGSGGPAGTDAHVEAARKGRRRARTRRRSMGRERENF